MTHILWFVIALYIHIPHPLIHQLYKTRQWNPDLIELSGSFDIAFNNTGISPKIFVAFKWKSLWSFLFGGGRRTLRHRVVVFTFSSDVSLPFVTYNSQQDQRGYKGEVIRICQCGTMLAEICISISFVSMCKDLDLRDHDSFGLPAISISKLQRKWNRGLH